MIYLGRYLPARTSGVEPALINPDLPVGAPDVSADPGPSPAYHLLSPAARTVYLRWLADGRTTDVPSTLVLLFCFGLERRVLADPDGDPAARRDLPQIAVEARRLQARYADGNPALGHALGRLLDLLDLLTAPRSIPGTGPAFRVSRMATRLAVARCAAASAPVSAAWACAWVRHHPSLPVRDVQVRCAEEFDRLFALRYQERHGAGLVPTCDAPGVRLRYQPANPSLTTTVVCREDLPDVLAEPGSTRALGSLADDVATALDPYRRWLARFPAVRGSLAAIPFLPPELVDPRSGRLGALRVWAEARLDGQGWAVIDVGEFARFWSTASPDRMARDETTALLEVLAVLGFGLEPDARFGAPTLAAGSAVLFRQGHPGLTRIAVPPGQRGRTSQADTIASDRPGSGFGAAAVVVRCAAVVASAARPLDPHSPAGAAVLATVRDVAQHLRLEPGEDLRLMARLAWLVTAGVASDRLYRQITPLDQEARELAGHYLVTVAAAADPELGPVTVAALTRVYRLLELEQDLVYRRLHEHATGSGSTFTRSPVTRSAALHSADEPVVVLAADQVGGGYALPWAQPPVRPPQPGILLDPAALARKVSESAKAASLLGEIFAAEPEPEPDRRRPAGPAGSGTPGLDQAHGRLLRALAGRSQWVCEEFAVLAAEHGVLPDGAIDLMNEVAFEVAGAPVITDGATLAVDHDIVRELLA